MWSTPARKGCFGKMFPDLLHLRANEACKGEIFGIRLSSSGIGVQSREVTVDQEKWEKCESCPRYRECFDLSTGTFMVEQAVWQK